MEYESKRDPKTGKIAVEERLTPARRFSYIVGENESCHTAQSRFLDLLQDTETKPPLAKIEEAFSVETVTDEFFIKYRALFEEIEKELKKLAAKDKSIGDEFKEKNVSTVDFAKKLMGQIVFLYFLQKKGWLGVAKGQDWGTGPHDFFRRLVRDDYGAYDNFFNDVLEPLFYDTLATDRGHEAWCNHFKCRIPFLNGGLFEPLADYDWRKTDIVLPNRLFTNTERFEELITGTGVLDVFDRYNFTVNEAEPLEKEVAIDPEMLGKVFENLIEENRRKGLGSFYTPREIVHYQCQECLINYLDTALNTDKGIVPHKDIETFIRLGEQISHYEAVDAKYSIKMPATIEKHARIIDEKLAAITVCDPAVGSGAYPVGMMTEIVRARCALTAYFNDVHEAREVGEELAGLGLVDMPGKPAGVGRAELRPDGTFASRFESGGFEHGQVFLAQLAFGNEFELETINAVSVVQVFGVRRVVEHLENPAQPGGAAVENGGKHLPSIAEHGGNARLAGGGINQADDITVIHAFPRFERGKVRGGGEQCAPGFGCDGRRRGEFGHWC